MQFIFWSTYDALRNAAYTFFFASDAFWSAIHIIWFTSYSFELEVAFPDLQLTELIYIVSE